MCSVDSPAHHCLVHRLHPTLCHVRRAGFVKGAFDVRRTGLVETDFLSGSMIKTERAAAVSRSIEWIISYSFAIFWSAFATMGYRESVPCEPFTSSIQLTCSALVFVGRTIGLMFLVANSLAICTVRLISVVQTRV